MGFRKGLSLILMTLMIGKSQVIKTVSKHHKYPHQNLSIWKLSTREPRAIEVKWTTQRRPLSPRRLWSRLTTLCSGTQNTNHAGKPSRTSTKSSAGKAWRPAGSEVNRRGRPNSSRNFRNPSKSPRRTKTSTYTPWNSDISTPHISRALKLTYMKASEVIPAGTRTQRLRIGRRMQLCLGRQRILKIHKLDIFWRQIRYRSWSIRNLRNRNMRSNYAYKWKRTIIENTNNSLNEESRKPKKRECPLSHRVISWKLASKYCRMEPRGLALESLRSNWIKPVS